MVRISPGLGVVALLVLLLLSPAVQAQKGAPGGAAKDLELVIGRGRTALLAEIPKVLESGAALQGLFLRACQRAGMGAFDTRVEPLWEALMRQGLGARPGALAQRLLLRLEASGAKRTAALDADLDTLLALQAADGGWGRDQRARGLLEERVTTSALVIEALRAALLFDLPIAEEVFQRAERFFLAAQRRSGAFGSTWRHHRPHGLATASALGALYALAAACRGAERRDRLLAAIERAEGWLNKVFRPDRNPGTSSGTGRLRYLAAFEPLLARSWIQSLGGLDVRARISAQLRASQLLDGGWNEAFAPSGLVPGGTLSNPDYNRPRGLDLGGQLAHSTPADTAWAVLALVSATRPSPAEVALAVKRRLEQIARHPRAVDPERFLARLADRALDALPPLLAGLGAKQARVRRVAARALQACTEKRFGYDPRRSAAANAEAIQRWTAWAAEQHHSAGTARHPHRKRSCPR